MIPSNIQESHLKKAIEEIRTKGVRKGRHSSTYDVLYEGGRYPPKLVVSIANRFANGEELDHNSFSGGVGTECFSFLKKNGFKIIKKTSNNDFAAQFREIIEINRLVYEKKLFKLGWGEMSEPYNKLIKPLLDSFEAKHGMTTQGFLKGFLKKVSFDEKLIEIKVFNHYGGRLNPFIWGTLYYKSNKDRDFSNSEQLYILVNQSGIKFGFGYGDRVTSGFPSVKKVKSRPDLQSLISGGINGGLYEALRLEPGSAVVPVSKKDKKKLYFESLSDYKQNWGEDVHLIRSYSFKNIPYNVGKQIADVYDNLSLLFNNIRKDKMGPSVVENKQYWLLSAGEKSAYWDVFYKTSKMGVDYNFPYNLSFYKSQKKLYADWDKKTGLKSSMNQKRALYDISMEMKKGDVVFVKKGENALLGHGVVVSNYFYKEGDSFPHQRGVDWRSSGFWEIDKYNLVQKSLTNITKFTDMVEHLKHTLGVVESHEKTEKDMKKSINQILYGPPGTGKTYTLKNEYFPLYTTQGASDSPEGNFKKVAEGLTWLEVTALALIEQGRSTVPEILKNRWLSYKMSKSKAQDKGGVVWSHLSYHTLENCEFVGQIERSNRTVFFKDKDKYWNISKQDAEEKMPHLFDILKRVNDFAPSSLSKKENYVFVTFHQSYAYEDFVEGIKPVMRVDDAKGAESMGYEVKNGVFKELCITAGENPNDRYAIFIDEINRGNVSAIFGELITLIEDDKRKGRENEISVTLPYSKEVFCVPANVDIYATMNTADRSVEALDTALRRRFSFKEVMPNPSVIKPVKIGGVDLGDVLTAINTRLEVLLDRDHTIGHSYFIGLKSQDDLKAVFRDRVVPLLQEYFYGDYGKIGLVLGEGFVSLKKKKEKPFASFNYEGKEDLNRSFYELNIIDKGFDIERALEALLNKNVEY